MTNLLILSGNPSRPSFRQRIEIYLPYLKGQNISCQIYKLPKNKYQRYKLLKSAKNYTAVLLHKKTLNFTDALILANSSRKIIYDFDDAIMFSQKKPASNFTSHRRLFKRTMKITDFVIAGNKYLAEYAKDYGKNIELIPTGLDTKIFDQYTKTDDGKIRLCWIGSKQTIAYLKQIAPALEEIGKKYNNVCLRIICDDFFSLQNMPVEKCRWSIDSQIPDLINCDIGLAPLPDDRFTRGKCGFKILQYFAASLPVVASPVGVNADFVTENKTGYHAVNIKQWIGCVSSLIDDKQKRIEMSKQAKLFASDFDRTKIAEKFTDIITSQIK